MAGEREEILERVARGELSPPDAVALLDALEGGARHFSADRSDEPVADEPAAGDGPEPDEETVTDDDHEPEADWADWEERMAEFGQTIGQWASGIAAQLPEFPVMPVIAGIPPEWLGSQTKKRDPAAQLASQARSLRRQAARIRRQAETLRRQAAEARASEEEGGAAERAERIEATAAHIEERATMLEDKAAEIDEQSEELRKLRDDAADAGDPRGHVRFRAGSGPGDSFNVHVGGMDIGSVVSRAVTSAFASVGRATGATETERVSHTVEVTGSPTVVVESDCGPVEVLAGDEGSVQVDAEKHAPSSEALARMSVEVTARDDMVRVTYRAGDWALGNRWVDLRVRVPRGCPVRLATGSGRVVMGGLRGGAEARTSAGDVRVDDLECDVSLHTSGGDIQARNLSGPLDAHTSGGDIEVAGTIGPGELRTSGGNVRLEGDARDTSLRTSGGNVTVRGRIEGTCSLHTSGGNIDVDRSAGTLDAKTSGGNIRVTGAEGSCRLRTSSGKIEVDALSASVDAYSSAGKIRVSGRLTGDSRLRATDTVTIELPLDASLRVEAKGRKARNDFDLPVERGAMSGVIGTGEDGSIEATSTSGLVWIRRIA